MEYNSIYNSKVGTIIITYEDDFLTRLWFSTSRFHNLREVKEEQINDEMEVLIKTKKWLDRYFNNEKPDINEISLKLVGSSFSNYVWEELKNIPYGAVVTYGDIAKKICKIRKIKNMSSQAVGHAVGHNPIAIIIPCHRVIGANNNLTGYGGGLDVKIGLLKHEGYEIEKLYRPKKGKAL